MLDYILTDEITANFCYSCEILNEGAFPSTSDHLPVLCRFVGQSVITNTVLENSKWTAWHKASIEQLSNYEKVLSNSLQAILNMTINDKADLEEAVTVLVRLLLDAAQRTLPV